MTVHRMRGVSVVFGVLGVVLSARAQPTDCFWIPALSIDAGYEDNRFLTATSVTNTEGTVFLRLAPSIGIRRLTPGGWDLGLTVRWGRTMYADGDLGAREETGLRAEAWRTGPGYEAGASVEAGWFTDDTLPADDQAWIGLFPSAQWYLGNPAWAVTAGGRVALTQYDNLTTSDDHDLTDTFLEVRAGLKWIPSRNATLWVEVYGETDASNQAGLDYQGVGAAAGADRWVTPRTRLSAWLRAGTREFPDSADPDLGLDERSDTPVSAGLSLVHRLRPWIELTCGASWRETGSNRDASDLSAWSASAGVTLTDEIPIRRRIPDFLADSHALQSP